MKADMVSVRAPKRNSVFTQPTIRIPRSQFDRSHRKVITFDARYLVPILVDEVLPGDTKTLSLDGFIRVWSPLDAPIMDDIRYDVFFFFIPDRLLWTNFEYFMGAHDEAGAQDVAYQRPVMGTGVTASHDNTGTGVSNLMGFMGIPHGLQTAQVDVQSAPFRAYNLVYNTWFRSQDLIDEVTVQKDDGPDTTANYSVLKSGKMADYFTTCLPNLQKGPAVTLDIDSQLPVTGIGADTNVWPSTPVSVYETGGSSTTLYTSAKTIDPAAANTLFQVEEDPDNAGYPGIFADGSALEINVNAMREAHAMQVMFERDARGGTRYVEKIKTQFGVTSPDYRHQRPEYLGGGTGYVHVSAVPNTSDTANAEQGELRGLAAGTMRGHGWAKTFTEHGWILGIIRARAPLTYFQGLDRMWSRRAPEEHYIPALAHLGEQAVLNKEIYVSNSAATDDGVFGYQERWTEYRFKKSELIGKVNPDVSGSLSFWHLAEDFGSLPSLNQTFIEDQTPMARVTTVDAEPDFIAHILFNYREARPIPVNSIPQISIGRF